ncbi:homologous-pairing protein 2 [Histomonas meleagridis]|uniref:homologous-pairing protein 2-like n=1 Tax=Histomonas meleagridis TaxID=135588 RepID=UPI0035595614|nr:homologous-pairing protein 2 [Histomonas meleagridis]KAH0805612.1 homologous-pairing protein 2-like [Histomonas meleagridis]
MPPKSKADPSPAIIKVLSEKNRPYSSTTLTDELHGEFAKSAVQKALDALAANGKITCKLFGKSTKLYFANQDGLEVASSDELAKMDANLEELRKRVETLKEQADELRARRDRLLATKTIQELRDYHQECNDLLEKSKAKRDELEEAAQGITFDDATNIQKQYFTRCEQWRKRKALCKQIVDTLCESTGQKPSQIFEELELETDESCNLKLVFQDRQYTITETA